MGQQRGRNWSSTPPRVRVPHPDRLGSAGVAFHSEAKRNLGSESVHCLSCEMHSGMLSHPFEDICSPERSRLGEEGWGLTYTQTFMRDVLFFSRVLWTTPRAVHFLLSYLFNDFVGSYGYKKTLESGSYLGKRRRKAGGVYNCPAARCRFTTLLGTP